MVRFPGELFLRVLQCLMIPLAITSTVSSVGSQATGQAALLVGRTLVYFFCTTLMAALTGLLLVMLIRPGVREAGKAGSKLPPYPQLPMNQLGLDAILDIIRLVPMLSSGRSVHHREGQGNARTVDMDTRMMFQRPAFCQKRREEPTYFLPQPGFRARKQRN